MPRSEHLHHIGEVLVQRCPTDPGRLGQLRAVHCHVPSGGAPTLRQLASPVLLDYLRNADRTAGMVTSVCTGSLLLAGAGLPAYHRFLERLGAIYVPQRWVEDGHYLTGAGVSAGSIPLCDSRPYSLETTLRARSKSLSSTTHSRRTAAFPSPTLTRTASDPASRDSPTRRWTTTPICLHGSSDHNREVEVCRMEIIKLTWVGTRTERPEPTVAFFRDLLVLGLALLAAAQGPTARKRWYGIEALLASVPRFAVVLPVSCQPLAS
jgi:hypothetical protein